MRYNPRLLVPAALVAGALAFTLVGPARAYVEAPMSLGAIVNQSSNILLMRVERVDRDKSFIIYRKVQDIKGKHPTDLIKHNILKQGLRANEWRHQIDWAETGKAAVFFYNGNASETCIGTWWYQAYSGGDWWNHSHGEPFLLRSFSGQPERLAAIVADMLAGRETVATCMVDGNKEDLHLRRGKVQRLRVSLKLGDYNPKRDFAGWGGDDFRRLLGMPAFTHYSGLGRADPEAQAISCVDFDGDGKTDVCLVGGGKVVVLQNGGESLNEIGLPGASGARAAVWADYNGDGLPDLLLATPGGPRLYTNLGKAGFRDDSHVLPEGASVGVSAAAWIDHDGDGRPDVLLASGYDGLRLYRNLGVKTEQAAGAAPRFGPWHVLGPLDNTGGRGFDTPHPVEKAVDLQQKHKGKGGAAAVWREAKFIDGNVNDLASLFPQHRSWAAAYLYREIDAPADAELPASLGSDDTLTVWLNGERLLANNAYRPCAPDQDRVTLKLRKGKNYLLMKICQGDGEWAFYFAAGEARSAPPRGRAFEDVSVRVGLGPDGIGAGRKGDTLTVCDVDGDGRPDFLYGAGNGILARNTGKGFAAATDSGIAYRAGKVGPVFGDFDGDGHPDLYVPQAGGGRLFRNDDKGRFADVTEKARLNLAGCAVTSAAWGDLDNDGHIDLLLGCLRGPNRWLRNRGDGTFEDATDRLGLGQRIFNTQAVALVDLNNDGALDAVFNNEGQESRALLGAPPTGKRAPLSVQVAGKAGVVGARVRVFDKGGTLRGAQEISGGDGRGGQSGAPARFALAPGAYRVVVRYSGGATREREITMAESPARARVDADGD